MPEFVTALASHGPLGLVSVVAIWAAWQAYKRSDDIQKKLDDLQNKRVDEWRAVVDKQHAALDAVASQLKDSNRLLEELTERPAGSRR